MVWALCFKKKFLENVSPEMLKDLDKSLQHILRSEEIQIN
jgi:hypothetical protein